MNLTIQTSANEILTLRPCAPSGEVIQMKVPGSRKATAEGEFGKISVEEFQSGPFILRYTIFTIAKKVTLYVTAPTPAICTRIATKNNWRFSLGAANNIKLREGQFALYRVGGGKEKLIFEKGKEYQSFEAFCPPGKLNGLIKLFPTLSEFLVADALTKPTFLVKRPSWAGPEAMDIIRDIPDCPFETGMRAYYVEHRMEELFFLLLALAFKNDPEETEPIASEIEAARAAEKIIMTDIKMHYSIPLIARRVHLNEFRLKYVFKHIYKVGIFEYLLQARMQEARRLLSQTDKPIKEITSLTGYQRLTSFITAFRKHFGYTPGSVRRTREHHA